MKILRTGPPWTLKTECPSCRSLLVIEANDITLETTRPPTSEDYGQHQWECPNCNCSYVITDIPEYVRVLARSKADWNVGQ